MRGVRRGLRTIRAGLMAGVCLGTVNAHAGDATWAVDAPNNNWNDGANWTSSPPHAVPDGTASFGASSKRSIVFSSNFTAIGNINFSATAPLYTFAIAAGQGFVVNGTANGGGIANSSISIPVFAVTWRSCRNGLFQRRHSCRRRIRHQRQRKFGFPRQFRSRRRH